MKIQDHQPHFVYLQTQTLLPYAITARKTNEINSAALAHHIHSGRNLKLRSVFTTYRHILPPLFLAFIKTNGLSYGL
jgi:lysozyme family protein